MAVAIKIAGALGVPARPRIAEAGAADDIGAVHFPDGRFAAVVLPQNVSIRACRLVPSPETSTTSREVTP